MRMYELLSEERTVGRNLQHLEDLVFVDGSAGAIEALDTLERFGMDVSDVSIKWDGTPAVIFGRDETGAFILTDLAGFGAKGYDGKVKSSKDLQRMILSRGKEATDSRKQYAAGMAAIWDEFESSVPNNTRGFFHGDLLYSTTPELNDGSFVFTPNKVTYTVVAESPIGKRIARSRAGVVVHTFTDLSGNTGQASATALNEGELFIMPPVIAQQSPQVDVRGVSQIRSIVQKNAAGIDELLSPKPGLSDMKNIIYTYVNQMSRAGKWDQLPTGFFDWLKDSKVSDNKKTKILALPESKYLPVLFDIVLKIQNLKNNVIDQLDGAQMDVTANIAGQPGGEGYVAARNKVKLVPRHRFTIS